MPERFGTAASARRRQRPALAPERFSLASVRHTDHQQRRPPLEKNARTAAPRCA
jgi:hypothetical protein